MYVIFQSIKIFTRLLSSKIRGNTKVA